MGVTGTGPALIVPRTGRPRPVRVAPYDVQGLFHRQSSRRGGWTGWVSREPPIGTFTTSLSLRGLQWTTTGLEEDGRWRRLVYLGRDRVREKGEEGSGSLGGDQAGWVRQIKSGTGDYPPKRISPRRDTLEDVTTFTSLDETRQVSGDRRTPRTLYLSH